MGRPDDFHQLFEKLPLGMLLIHRDGHVLLSNPVAAEQLGAPCTPGSKSPIFLPPGQHQVPSPALEAGPLEVNVFALSWHGEDAFIILMQDSESLGWTSQDTEQLAYEDTLTGLPNLNILRQFIEFTCTQAQRYGRSASLILVDIDDFRGLKQQLGEAASDQLLVDAAGRLQQTVRSSDLVGRRGQDQFIVLLTELTDDRSKERAQDQKLTIQERASRVAERILREFETPFTSRDVPVSCRLSLGLTVCPQQATTPEAMLYQAEVALRQAKSLGGERFVVYDGSLDQRLTERTDLTTQVTQALRSQTLGLDFEPWLDAASGETLAYQVQPALAGAGDIWSLAEQEGFLSELFDWTLTRLGKEGKKPFVLPLSSHQLLHRELPSSLPKALTAAGLEPSQCYLQVSEAALLRDVVRRIPMLRSLREQGFQVVLDMGLGSLQLLQQLRPDWVRVSSRSALFAPLLSLAGSLQIDVIATEVDEVEQLGQGIRAYSGKARRA